MTLKEYLLNNNSVTVNQYSDRVHKIILNTIEKSLKLADKYGIDRNDVLTQVSIVLYETVQIGNFEQYELEK